MPRGSFLRLSRGNPFLKKASETERAESKKSNAQYVAPLRFIQENLFSFVDKANGLGYNMFDIKLKRMIPYEKIQGYGNELCRLLGKSR